MFREESNQDIIVEETQPNDLFAVKDCLSRAIVWNVDMINLHHCHFAEQIRQTSMVLKKEN